MDALRIFLAIGLPWVAGAVLVRRCWRGSPEGAWAAIAGYGYVVGMLGVAPLLRAMDAVGFPLAFEPVAVALAGMAAWGGWRSRGASWAAWGEGILSPGWRGQALWEKAVFLCLLAAVALRLAGLGLEAATSPLFGWDAWATWAPKARVFFELRRIAPFVE